MCNINIIYNMTTVNEMSANALRVLEDDDLTEYPVLARGYNVNVNHFLYSCSPAIFT